MKHHLTLVIITFAVVAVSLIIPIASSVHALECGALPSELCESATKEVTTVGDTAIWDFLRLIISILVVGAGIAALGGIIYGAATYASAGGNQEQVKRARQIFTSVVIGIIVFAGLFSVSNWLMPGGVFNGNVQLSTTNPSTPSNPSNPSGPRDPSSPSSPSNPDASSDTAVKLGRTAVTAVTWNSLFSNNTALATGAKSIGGKADVIGFQEVHYADKKHRESLLKDFMCSSCTFNGYMDPYDRNKSGSKPASLPIAWKKSRFDLVKSGYKNVYIAKSSDGNGSSKWITYVKLRDKKTKDTFYVVNTHTVAGVESRGKPSDATRNKLFKKHMDTLTSMIKGFQGEKIPVVVLGDFNVNYRYDKNVQYKDFPHARLRSIGLKSNWELLNLSGVSSSAGTNGSGSRLIDYVWLWGPTTQPVSSSIGGMYGSDHRAVYLHFTFGQAAE